MEVLELLENNISIRPLLRHTGRIEIFQAAVEAMAPYVSHCFDVNVDFYPGVIYYLRGILSDMFVAIFALGRVSGWIVQVLEQLETNISIRPLRRHSGPAPRAYISMKER